MTAEELYGLYEQAQLDLLGCEVDPWVELDAGEKTVWAAIAARICV